MTHNTKVISINYNRLSDFDNKGHNMKRSRIKTVAITMDDFSQSVTF
jgi:hypothetical protein